MPRKSLLLHPKFDGRDGVRAGDRKMFIFVFFDEEAPDLELRFRRRARRCVHERLYLRQRGHVFRFGFNYFGIHGLQMLVASMSS